MFTGIIETTSQIVKREDREHLSTFTIARPSGWELTVGQSIAVSGACLTVVTFSEEYFIVELMLETLAKTIFKNTNIQNVNLERAMLATARFEGHMVQGHVDTVGKISKLERAGETAVYSIVFDQKFAELVVTKGSITIDGVSLTVSKVESGVLFVALIPYTLSHTTLGEKKVGEEVNLEFDILGKYIVKNKFS